MLMLVVNLLARRAVRPVLRLANQISGRQAHDLEPFGTVDLPRELRPVVHELNLLLQRVRESMGREQRFLDAAAHELRTPLTAVQLHLENALGASEPLEHQASLQQAQAACRRTVRLAEQLLAYSRVSAAGFESRAPVDLGATADSVAAMMAPILEQRGQTVVLSNEERVMIPAVRFKIEQLVQNLLSNASSHGAPNTGIHVGVALSNHHARLTIRNEGPNLPADDLTKVFIPHYRVRGTKSDGNGLGLAIVREIVSQHQGEVWLENTAAPTGVQVVVQFPRA
jgi:two-component system sensor histidine kinase QseC